MKIIMCVCAYVYEGGRKGRGRRVDTSFFFFLGGFEGKDYYG